MRDWMTLYRNSGKRRGLCFALSVEQFKELTSGDCYYCGEKPLHEYWARRRCEKTENAPYFCNGIDRKDSSIGYTIENCVSCCSPCNIAKMEQSEKDFIDRCRRVASHQESRELEQIIGLSDIESPDKAYI